MPAKESSVVRSPKIRYASIATNTGWVETRTTLAATLVWSREEIQNRSLRTSAGGSRSAAPSAQRQKATAMAGASASRMKIAAAETASTPTATAGSANLPRTLSCTKRAPPAP